MTIDHLILATPDLGATVADIERLTGVPPMPGGRHPVARTVNYLLGLGGDVYLEIIGRDEQSPDPTPRPFGLDTLTEPRLVGWALRVDDIHGRVATSRERGHDPGPVVHRSRRAPDGELLEVRTTHLGTGLLPFLVDWGNTRHPAAALPIVPLMSLTGVHPDPGPTREALSALGAELDVRPGNRVALFATLRGGNDVVLLT